MENGFVIGQNEGMAIVGCPYEMVIGAPEGHGSSGVWVIVLGCPLIAPIDRE